MDSTPQGPAEGLSITTACTEEKFTCEGGVQELLDSDEIKLCADRNTRLDYNSQTCSPKFKKMSKQEYSCSGSHDAERIETKGSGLQDFVQLKWENREWTNLRLQNENLAEAANHSRSKSTYNDNPRKRTSNWDRDSCGNVIELASKRNSDVGSDILAKAISNSSLRHRASRARTIHVGNLPRVQRLTEELLGDFFNAEMHKAGFTSDGSNCVTDVWISSERKFAFIELRSLKEADELLALDGICLHDSKLKLSRPHDYVAPPTHELVQRAISTANDGNAQAVQRVASAAAGALSLHVAGSSSGRAIPSAVNKAITETALVAIGYDPKIGGSLVKDMSMLLQSTRKCRRVHIGNLPKSAGLTSGSLRDFIAQLMQQLSLVVRPGDPVVDCFISGDGKFGFVEMRTIQEASNAQALTGAILMGRPVRVGRPADYVAPSAELLQLLEGTGILGFGSDLGVELHEQIPASHLAAVRSDDSIDSPGPNYENLGNSEDTDQIVSIARSQRETPTAVVALTNIISTMQLIDAGECAEIAADVKAKCEEEFGRVVGVSIARHGCSAETFCATDGQEAPFPLASSGQVLVQFEQVDVACRAVLGLDMLRYDGRVIRATFASPAQFAAASAFILS